MGNFLEGLSQAMLVGVMIVGRLGVLGGSTPKRRVTSETLMCPSTSPSEQNPILKHRASCVALAERTNTYTHTYIYIYICICVEREREREKNK